MVANKKRKLEPQADKRPILSAFAARRGLSGFRPDSPSTGEATRRSSDPESPSTKQAGGSREHKNSVVAETKAGAKTETEAGLAVSLAAHPSNSAQHDVSLPAPSSASTPSAPSAKAVQTPDPPRRTVLQHSTFKPTRKTHQRLADGRSVLKLGEGERLLVLGSYGLQVREGEVTIAGATLRPDGSIHWAHAPHCHALPVLRTTDDAVIELHPHPAARGLRALEKLSPVFGRLWNDSPQRASRSGSNKHRDGDSYQIVYTSDDSPRRAVIQELVSPAEWNKKIAGLASAKSAKPPVLFVCGPKSSGKSTFAKLLANRLLTHQDPSRRRQWQTVAVLDLDPGQPEYAAPGVISLVHVSRPVIAPPFCHPQPEQGNEVLRSHAIASVSLALDPAHYIDCVEDLFRHYQRGLATRSPLVINTPGWVQGTGLEILLALVEKIHPGEVVYMSRDGPEDTVQGLKAACHQDILLTALPSQASEYTSRTALHLRTMQAMSYFHAGRLPAQQSHLSWDPRPLTDVPPWKVRFRGPNRGILGLLCYDHQPPSDLLVEAINGMIVGLAVVEDGAALGDLLAGDPADGGPVGDAGVGMQAPEDRRKVLWTPEGLPLIPNPAGRTLDPRHSRLAGLALVRGVDVQQGELHMLTPLSEGAVSGLAEQGMRLVLVAGKFDTPTWAYTEDMYSRSSVSNEAESQTAVEVADEDTDDDSSQAGFGEEGTAPEGTASAREYTESPWVELLHGNQKRSVGSRVWRVRRDLGRGGP